MLLEIKCINKEDRQNPWERITHIGGVNNDLTKWRITQEKAIEYIKTGKYSFYVNVLGNKVKVIVSESRFGNEYIKTESNGDEPNNLLSLSECRK